MHNTSWARGRLGDYAYIKARIGWRGLSASEYTQDGPYLIAGNHIQNGLVDWASCDHVSTYRYQESLEIALRTGDIILTKDGTIGRIAIVTNLPGLATINGTMMLIRVKPPLQPRYVYHYLTGETFQRLVADKVSGSSIPHIFQRDMLRLPILIPSEREQKYISCILDTLDTQIQHTEQLISKLKHQKIGLLQDLLTRGLDKYGQLRNPVAYPEQFKDSVLGRIPKEWEVVVLGPMILQNGAFIQTGPFGSQLHASEYVSEGIPLIMPQDIRGERIDKSRIAYISPTKADVLLRHRVEFNDVIFARRGDLDRCAFINTPEVGSICGTDCLLIRPPKKLIDGRWLAAIYRHHYSQQQIRAWAVGSTMVGLNTQLLANLMIAMPPLKEQVSIMNNISSVDNFIYAEEAYHNKLRLYKKGLMQDLLSGRVQVHTEEKTFLENDLLYQKTNNKGS